MNFYRTHHCEQLRASDAGKDVRLSGWLQSKRDHGGVLFLDLRDSHGVTQIVVPAGSPLTAELEKLRIESVITIEGKVILRGEGQQNAKIPTGEIEVSAEKLTIISSAEMLPFQIHSNEKYPEDLRLKYRFLDLRRPQMRNNILLRSKVISSLRRHMEGEGFLELQTPILTASSPEGARDFLVPARLHPGKFYALPQAPQQFKQLAMVGGFEKYFQIAPCFRDEASRADRSPGEFYQMDMEMAFATQDDVFEVLERVLSGVFKEFVPADWNVDTAPFRRIPYAESMAKYGCDKPDLRNPLILSNVTEAFENSSFGLFAKIAADGGRVVAIPAPGAAEKGRAFFDKLNKWAREEGMGGLGYVIFAEEGAKGPIAKNLEEDRLAKIKEISGVKDGDAVFFLASSGKPEELNRFAAVARMKVAESLDLVEKNAYRFCWVVDFPMYERDEETGQIDFSHNPFSMPQGGMDALLNKDPLEINAWQYDIVCNGVELSSGAIRNHQPELMIKAFEIAGYPAEEVEKRFGGLYNAFKFGAPPHGGAAPGVDRMVMLLADEPNIREVTLFPLNQKGEDLMMEAPAEITPERWKELNLKLSLPPKPTVSVEKK
ncbi:aspartate--tRNA ligase [Acetobacteraceae bacterium]|nr:aspartate--tRNA ligase [Acetobacteraceae bacterium]